MEMCIRDRYYGLIGDDYEQECVKSIEDSVFQGDTKDQLQNEKERDNTITLQLTTKVQASDEYATTYGFSVGDTIEKTITMDKKTQIVTSVEEKCGDEVFYGYNVEFDGQKKVPVFYQKLEKEKRVCTVYSDYNGENNQEYTYSIPVDVYFTVLDLSLIHILKSEHIIQRKVLNKVAYDLKKELFGKTSVFISFDDTYELSAAYTLESITNDYWGSILHEVKNMGRVEYSLLANGEWGFEGNIMTILLEDSFLARDKSRVLKEYMEHLFSHRFGKEIQVDVYKRQVYGTAVRLV